MSSPQVEEGYTKIANSIMDALIALPIPARSRQVLDFIIRKTYGWNKKSDRISMGQIEAATGIKRIKIYREIDRLEKMKLINRAGKYKVSEQCKTCKNLKCEYAKDRKGESPVGDSPLRGTVPSEGQSPQRDSVRYKKRNLPAIYCFQKDFDKWLKGESPTRDSPLRGTRVVPSEGLGIVPYRGHTKDNITKDNITKERVCSPPDFHLDLFDRFYAAYPKKKNRFTALAAWKEIKPDKKLFMKMMESLNKDIKSPEWNKDEGAFIPLPGNWLHNLRWEDSHAKIKTIDKNELIKQELIKKRREEYGDV